MKKCTKCGVEKPLTEFHNNKSGKDGKLAQCKACKAEYREQHYSNPDNVKIRREGQKKYREDNKDLVRERNRKYKEKNPDKVSAWAKKHYASHRDEVCAKRSAREKKPETRRKRNARTAEYLASNPVADFKYKTRQMLNKAYSRTGVAKTTKALDILGCDFEFLKYWLELTFVENYAIDIEDDMEIHLDHIIPLSTAKTEEDVIRLNHYTNLQWLLATDNFSKGERLDWAI